MLTLQGLCEGIRFNNSFISDNAGLIDQTYYPVFNDILKNLKKDTKIDIAVITLTRLESGQTFKDVEAKVLAHNPIGGYTHKNYVLVIATKYPFEIYMSRSNSLRKIIPDTMLRALKFETWVEKKLSGIGYASNVPLGATPVLVDEKNYNTSPRASMIIYSKTLAMAEAIADQYGVKLKYDNELYIMGMLMTGDYTMLPSTNPILKTIRKYNLYPALIALILGILPYIIRARIRYFRRIFGFDKNTRLPQRPKR